MSATEHREDRLRRIAERATLVGADYEEHMAEDACYGTENGCPGHRTGVAEFFVTYADDDGDPRIPEEPGDLRVEDAAFLAALDKQTVLALLDVARAARRQSEASVRFRAADGQSKRDIAEIVRFGNEVEGADKALASALGAWDALGRAQS